MDVRCERCRAQYVFDDDQVTRSGLTVQCTNCGHLFKVKKKELVVTVPVKPEELEGAPLPATAAAPKPRGAAPGAQPAPAPVEPPREWRVRQVSGNTLAFRELTTLHKWIVEQKVSPDDEISLGGEAWKRLGSIAELSSFFEVVEAAERGKTLSLALAAAQAPASPPAAEDPAASGPSVDVDLGVDEPGTAGKGRRRAPWITTLALLVAGGTAAAWGVPRLLSPGTPGSAAPAPVAAPPPPLGPAEEPPAHAVAPVPEPEPGKAQEPAPRLPTTSPPPAPRGAKALLAEASRLRDRGEIEKALDLYGQVSGADPRNVAALVGRGLCYLDLETYPPAAASFEAALGVRAEDPEALLGLAETYRWQGKKADAIRYYERYLAAHPDGEEAPVARNALEELRK